MKRLFTSLMVVALAVVMVGCNNDGAAAGGSNYTMAVSDNAVGVVRFDVNQVLEKSGMKAELTQKAEQAMAQQGMPKMLRDLVVDFRNTGIDMNVPAYAWANFIDSNTVFVGVVAKVASKSKFENLLNYLNKESGGELPIKSNNDYTIIYDAYDPEVVLAFNNEAVVIGTTQSLENDYYSNSKKDAKPYVVEAIQNVISGVAGGSVLPTYEGSDAALCINMNPFMDAMQLALRGNYDADLAMALAQMEPVRNAKFNFAFNFAQGSIDFNMMVQNIPNNMGYAAPHCSNANLQYVSADALAVANLPIDGAAMLTALNTVLDNNPEIKQQLNDVLKSELSLTWNAILPMATPLVNSLKGDITVACNDIKLSTYYDPYYGYYGDYRTQAELDGCALVGVSNNTIMNTVSGLMIAVPEVSKVGADTYTTNFEGNKVYFGQKGNALFLSSPYVLESASRPATSAEWYPAVQNSYGYVVVNIASMLKNPTFYKALNDEVKREFDSSAYTVMQLADALNYFVISVPSQESVSMRLVLKNANTNALAQLANIVRPEVERLLK